MNPSILAICLLAMALSPSHSFGITSLGSPLSLYKQALAAKPLITNMVTAGSLSVMSDSITQKAEKMGTDPNNAESHSHNYYRSATMFVYGLFVSGWFVSEWFKILNRWIPTDASSNLLLVIKKVVVNQICMSPILNSLFFIWVGATRGGLDTNIQDKTELILRKITQDLVPTMKRSCGYWGVINIANFSVIPQRYQLLFTNIGFVLWFAYLSFVGYRDKKGQNNK